MTRVCCACKQELPATEEYFYKNPKIKNRFTPRSKCKKCFAEATKIHRKEREKLFEEIYASIDREGLTKKCGQCGEELPATLEYFFKSSIGRYGLRSKCKDCFTVQAKALKRKPKYRRKAIEHGRKYYAENKELFAARWQKYYHETKEYHLQRAKDYRKNNFEKCKEAEKRYAENNKERVRQKWKRSRNRKRTLKKQLPNTLTFEQWNECQTYFNHACAYCGKKKKLTQDHFTALIRGGEYTRDNIIPVCVSCNSSKQAKDFFGWYPGQPFYSATRERKILKYLNRDDTGQQPTLLTLVLRQQ